MTTQIEENWNPETYGRFRGFRLRPAVDLLKTIPEVPDGDIVDLGCGAGVMGEMLAARFPAQRLVGVDSSLAMLDHACATGRYSALVTADIATWQPKAPLSVIFSNAALQWVQDHEEMLPRLAGFLSPLAVLAVQMPHQNDAPSHRMWNISYQRIFGSAPAAPLPSVMDPEEYFEILSPLGEFQLWETEYFQELAPSNDGHPVRLFTESTYAGAMLGQLNEQERSKLIGAYEDEMERAYPCRADGSVLFVFKRLFFTLKVCG